MFIGLVVFRHRNGESMRIIRVFPNELKFHQLNPDSVFRYTAYDSDVFNAFESDYSVVAKVPCTDNTNTLFFMSSRDIGLIATVNYITSPETLYEFENSFQLSVQKIPYFETCFKILGLQRNIRSFEMLHVNLNSQQKTPGSN